MSLLLNEGNLLFVMLQLLGVYGKVKVTARRLAEILYQLEIDVLTLKNPLKRSLT